MSLVQSECPGDIRPAVLRWRWEVFTDSPSSRKMQRKKRARVISRGLIWVTWDFQLLCCIFHPLLCVENAPFLRLPSLTFWVPKIPRNKRKKKFQVLFFFQSPLSLALWLCPSIRCLSPLIGDLLSRWKHWNRMEHFFWPQPAGPALTLQCLLWTLRSIRMMNNPTYVRKRNESL